MLGNSLSVMRLFARLGVRCVTLTHVCHSCQFLPLIRAGAKPTPSSTSICQLQWRRCRDVRVDITPSAPWKWDYKYRTLTCIGAEPPRSHG